VSRIGIFKFTTANRNFGYQLHLARMAAFLEKTESGDVRKRVASLMDVDWEEALRAWRVVQVAVFRSIYRTPRLTGLAGRIDWRAYKTTDAAATLIAKYTHRETDLRVDDIYPWWNPELLTKLHQGYQSSRGESIYYTGTYLRDMLGGLHFMQWLLIAQVMWAAAGPHLHSSERVALTLVVALAGTLVFLRQVRIDRRREILENEALSIHSCAITWAFVVIVHTLASRAGESPYLHYTQRLAALCEPGRLHALDLPRLTREYIYTGRVPNSEIVTGASAPRSVDAIPRPRSSMTRHLGSAFR
jgi:hypothetical protein